ncbi:hypothetical protein O1611_g10208 [Lasiodiplodia mahajangana]|uniref:Uncharacterized protein n=1 Tax=Lasiodiplodia mahajangana TaxID=1108764 RepID=A0ACC2J0M6_9PEZI|nr:hypothetical protein O1611_g10208 [Lasiodiplodia mahajangana]
MVIRTPPLSSLRTGFLPQIHHPLPLNRRESQKLLDTITSSFRKNLDREHPWQTDETPANTPPNSKSTDSVEPLLATATNHRPTDRHLRAILSNPLFAHPRDADAGTSLRTTTNKPFEVFDSAVSKGLMTPRRAAGFLAAVRSRLLAESPDGIRQRMGMSGGGLRVIRWLRASGLENDLDFLSDSALIRQIIPFLYAEGLQEIAWTWLAQLAARAAELEFEKTPGKANAQTLFRLMSAIIDENIQSGSQSQISLDESFAALVKANGMLPHDNPAANAAVKSAWAKLSWTSTVDALERPKPSVTLFENFVDIGRPLNLPLDLAHLDLHHPTAPTHSTAVEYLRARQQIVEKVSKMNPRAQQRVLCFVLDAAERLKRTGQIDEAPWVERIKSAIFDRLNLAVLNIQGGYSLNSSIPIREGALNDI